MSLEIHPFPPFISCNATHLILGSFPTLKKNWRFNFFYPGRSNFFWKMLSEIYRHPFQHFAGEEAAQERLELCKAKGIALSDTVYSCKRKAISSKDSDLIVVEKMNILGMLKQHSSIHTVILTGSSGDASAQKIFYEHLNEHQIAFNLLPSKPPISGSFILSNREIKVHSLYSTSGINIGKYKEAVEQYRKHLRSEKILLQIFQLQTG